MNHISFKSTLLGKTFSIVAIAAILFAGAPSTFTPFARAQAVGPQFSQVAIVPSSGTVGSAHVLDVYFQEATNDPEVTLGGTCQVNGIHVSPLQNLTGGLYKVVYSISDTDSDRLAGTVPVNCTFQNASGATTTVAAFNDGNTLAIDVMADGITPPVEEPVEEPGDGYPTPSMSAVASVPNSGTIDTGESMEVYFQEANNNPGLTFGGPCTVNNVSVAPLHNLTGGLYKVIYTVGASDMSRAAGQVPLSCMFQNTQGSTTSVSAFTDNNTVAINASTTGGNATTTPPGSGSSNGGTIGGNVNGSVNDAPLAVSSITQVQGTAIADNTYANGWKWTFNVTVPSNETSLQMKFADWTDGSGHTITAGGNMRIYSDQSNPSTAVDITASNVYSGSLNLAGDMSTSTPGRQIQIQVEMKIPTTAVNGSYTTSYGIKTF